jgi:putative ABC transport system substrate-binding protein
MIISILATGFMTSPLPANAQKSGKVFRIGWLSPFSVNSPAPTNFLDEFRTLGWVEGKDFVLEYKQWKKNEQRFELAAGLVRLKVDLIVTTLTTSTHAAKDATSTIPIVFIAVTDPVGDGFVTSITRPGGNVTGVCPNLIEISGKVLQLLTEAVPEASRFAFLRNAALGRIARLALEEMQAAAKILDVTLQSVEVREGKDFEPAFAAMVKERVRAVVVGGDQLTFANMPQIAELALENKLPTMVHGPSHHSVEKGALMSYAPLYGPQNRRAAHLVDKILKGSNPAELPVELPTHYEFAINLKTAKALGITIPPALLMRATKVIE